ncbi:hypothetical protein Ecwhy1_330 [Escherichia phage Ecwhy_1]|uniref:Uncharacterized protein n=1 Tax=Escherichia phage fEgEco12 TaxID=3158837 RepID=A0AAU7PIV2_9CAUD|nr:hypothetical protein Ecwhy1_330 [Escherichia phage Ecwhy_1]
MNEYYQNLFNYIKQIDDLAFDFLSTEKVLEPLYYDCISSLCLDEKEILANNLPSTVCTINGSKALVCEVNFHKSLNTIVYKFDNTVFKHVTSNIKSVRFL